MSASRRQGSFGIRPTSAVGSVKMNTVQYKYRRASSNEANVPVHREIGTPYKYAALRMQYCTPYSILPTVCTYSAVRSNVHVLVL